MNMLYLHIGTGKTGSTSIQKFLKRNRALLPHNQLDSFGIGNSWRLAAASGTCQSYEYFTKVSQKLSSEEFKELNRSVWNQAGKEICNYKTGDFIASSEFLYHQFSGEHYKLEEFKEKLEQTFGQICVIIYFRNQIEYLRSAYAQRIKGVRKDTLSYSKFILNADALNLPIDYAENLRVWGEIFGWNNLRLNVFDRRNFKNNDLIEDFCHFANIPLDESKFKPSQVESNTSPSFSEVKAIRMLNLLGVKNTRKRNLLNPRTYAKIYRDFPTKHDNIIIKKVSEGNAWMNDLFFQDLEIKLPTVYE